MDLVPLVFLCSFCSSALVTPDHDGSLFFELMQARPVEQAIQQFNDMYMQKRGICIGIIKSLYFKNLDWVDVENPEVYEYFVQRCPDRIPDHYDQNDIHGCFAVKDQVIMVHNQYEYSLKSFACLAQDLTNVSNDPYREIFVSYTNVRDTFILSLRENGNMESTQMTLHYMGIAEKSPTISQNFDVQSRERFFKIDSRQQGNSYVRLNQMSLNRRNRLCQIVLSSVDNSTEPETIESLSIIPNAKVQLTNEQLVVDALLPCSVIRNQHYYHPYVALSKLNRTGVYILKRMRNVRSRIYQLTDYHLEDIPTLSENYRPIVG